MPLLWAPQFKFQDVAILKEVEAFSGYCQIKQYQFTFSLFNGGKSQPVDRELVIRPPAVAALLVDPNRDKVVLLEQFRTGAIFEKGSPWLLEIVAGVLEPEEKIEEALYREIKEETNCEMLSCIPICTYLTTPGISNEKILLFCAQVEAPKVAGIHGIVAEGEDIKIHVFNTEEALRLLNEGKIISSPAVIALQWLKINQSSLHFPR